MSALDALKARFRNGQHAEAIAGCEALCAEQAASIEALSLCAKMHALTGSHARALELLRQVRQRNEGGQDDAELLFNIGLCERELQHFDAADQTFAWFTEKFAGNADGWACRAECKFQLSEYAEGARLADRAIQLAPSLLAAWMVRGHCQKALGQFKEALASYAQANRIQPSGEACFNAGLVHVEANRPTEAIESFTQAMVLAPKMAPLIIARGDTFQRMGKLHEAANDYMAALKLTPNDGDTLRKATHCLLEQGRGCEALDLCRGILARHPDHQAAKLGAEWVLIQQVPLYHIPMMNEPERNQAYHDGLACMVTPDKLVLEIGTGSGLLAMMAARLGAQRVVTCEAVSLVARTAATIVRRNGLNQQVKVVAKPSQQLQVGADLPHQADILVHEIFSSELLAEHVLPAIEDAKARLLKPGGMILPRAASLMIALVGGDELALNVCAGESFGFDLRDFNDIYPTKRPLYREDLQPVLMSDAVEAFRFDFAADASFPPERKHIDITATQAGQCYGIIQWIRIELAEGIVFENRPGPRRAVTNWAPHVYGFAPMELTSGQVVPIVAMHDRERPWFELASGRKP